VNCAEYAELCPVPADLALRQEIGTDLAPMRESWHQMLYPVPMRTDSSDYGSQNRRQLLCPILATSRPPVPNWLAWDTSSLRACLRATQ
jgi:hypothetical protein